MEPALLTAREEVLGETSLIADLPLSALSAQLICPPGNPGGALCSVLTEQSVCEFMSLCCGEGDWPDLWLWVIRNVASYWLETPLQRKE